RQSRRIEKGLFRASKLIIEQRSVGGRIGLDLVDRRTGCCKTLCRSKASVEVNFQICPRSMALGGLDVAKNLLSIKLVIVRKDIGVGHVENFQSKHSRLLLFISEGRVAELNKPVVIIESRVIDPIRAVRTNI